MRVYRISDKSAAETIDKLYRLPNEFMPQAKGTSMLDIIAHCDKNKRHYDLPMFMIEYENFFTQSEIEMCHKIQNFLTSHDCRPLFISYQTKDKLTKINFAYKVYDVSTAKQILKAIGALEESCAYYGKEQEEKVEPVIEPKKKEKRVITEEDIEQENKKKSSTFNAPFLNQLDTYRRQTEDEGLDIYDALATERNKKIDLPYKTINMIFTDCMCWLTGTEKSDYFMAQRGEYTKEQMLKKINGYIEQHHGNSLTENDKTYLTDRLMNAVFGYYVLQPLIDDNDVTDIKVTAYDGIRARINGDAYCSNLKFSDENDYCKFVEALAERNNIGLEETEQTFTDDHNDTYLMRFSLTAKYIGASKTPYLHIRKTPRKKRTFDDLVRLGMMPEKVKDYLIDCANGKSRGIVFAGPPGSGKSSILNAFIEYFPAASEPLIIQDSDELTTERPGYMFLHTVKHPQKGEKKCTLQDLGEFALVAGCNIFVIGEAKGAEITSAILLGNSGCQTCITIHSPSAAETYNKMANLALEGGVMNMDTAMRSLTTFQTIVYLEKYRVKEITETTGFDEATKLPEFRYIYRADAEK